MDRHSTTVKKVVEGCVYIGRRLYAISLMRGELQHSALRSFSPLCPLIQRRKEHSSDREAVRASPDSTNIDLLPGRKPIVIWNCCRQPTITPRPILPLLPAAGSTRLLRRATPPYQITPHGRVHTVGGHATSRGKCR